MTEVIQAAPRPTQQCQEQYTSAVMFWLEFAVIPRHPFLRTQHPIRNKKMTVRAGREFLAIPGPTTMPDEVLRAMHRPALDIYSEQMVGMTDSLLRDLSKLFSTKGHSYIYIANGHGAWEATLSNVLSRGDKVLVLESGRFAIGWGNAAAAMGADVEVLKGDWRRAIRPAEVEARLRQDKDHKIKAILAVQVDTASGAYNDIEAIGKAIKATGHPALFMVDAVASLGCMPFEMDAWGVDVAMSGSQKGLMAPPGLGFVAAGYLTGEELAARLVRARALTDGPLGVNVFVLRETAVDHDALTAYALELEPEAAALGVELGDPHFDDDELEAKLEAAAGVDVLSTTFGCLDAETIARVHASGTSVWATVTYAAEACVARDAGVDALVVQGAEAGGHSGAWSDTGEPAPPLLALLAEVRAVVDLPLVATGGIADRAGVAAALAAGAAAVQAGSAFLLAPEAGTSEPHRRALRDKGQTALTRAFTGRRARGILNEFMRAHPDAPSAYPHVHHLTAPLRAASRAAGDEQRINLWAGVNYARAEELPAAEIVARLEV